MYNFLKIFFSFLSYMWQSTCEYLDEALSSSKFCSVLVKQSGECKTRREQARILRPRATRNLLVDKLDFIAFSLYCVNLPRAQVDALFSQFGKLVVEIPIFFCFYVCSFPFLQFLCSLTLKHMRYLFANNAIT